MTERLRKNLITKRKKWMTKFDSAREKFEEKKGKITADLEEAGKIWKGVSERFKWWQKQELP